MVMGGFLVLGMCLGVIHYWGLCAGCFWFGVLCVDIFCVGFWWFIPYAVGMYVFNVLNCVVKIIIIIWVSEKRFFGNLLSQISLIFSLDLKCLIFISTVDKKCKIYFHSMKRNQILFFQELNIYFRQSSQPPYFQIRNQMVV